MADVIPPRQASCIGELTLLLVLRSQKMFDVLWMMDDVFRCVMFDVLWMMLFHAIGRCVTFDVIWIMFDVILLRPTFCSDV